MDMLSRILIDGSILCLVMGALIFGSLAYNPRLWIQDFPKAIQAIVPPLTASEKRIQRLFFVPFLLAMLGIPLYSTWLLKQQNGGELTFVSAWLNTFFVTSLFNLFDALVIDLLVLTFIKPHFAFNIGVELPAEMFNREFHNWNWHFMNYLKGVVFSAVFSLVIALVVMAL